MTTTTYAKSAVKNPTLSVLIPFYNEREYLPRALSSLLSQSRPPDEVILVDNGSTDGSGDWCRQWAGLAVFARIVVLKEELPGKIHALKRGLDEVTCDVVATWDADIEYPPHYLELGEHMLLAAKSDVAAAMAVYLHGPPQQGWHSVYRWVMPLISNWFPTKCLTGGGGQLFRTALLRMAGGFDAERWPYVLLDHEVMNRVFHFGKTVYDPQFWCLHSQRRGDRTAVRWTVWERFLYLYMPPAGLEWFFYRFLGPRLRQRRQDQLSLRQQPWQGAAAVS